MTDALANYSAVIAQGDGADPEVFTTIAEVTKIGGVGVELMTEDATSLDSGGWEEHIGTILKVPDLSLEVNFLPANATQSYAAGITADIVARTTSNYKVTFPDSGSTEWVIPALPTKLAVDIDAKGKLKGTFTLKPTGAPTLA